MCDVLFPYVWSVPVSFNCLFNHNTTTWFYFIIVIYFVLKPFLVQIKTKQKRVIIFIVITSPFLIGSNNLIVPKQQALATFGWCRQYTRCWVIARYLIATFLSGSGAADKPFIHEWTKNHGERLYCYRKKKWTAICLKVNGRNARIRNTYCSMYFLRSICNKKIFLYSLCLAKFEFHDHMKSPRVAGAPVVGKCPIPGLHQNLLMPHPGNDRAQKQPAFGSEDN